MATNWCHRGRRFCTKRTAEASRRFPSLCASLASAISRPITAVDGAEGRLKHAGTTWGLFTRRADGSVCEWGRLNSSASECLWNNSESDRRCTLREKTERGSSEMQYVKCRFCGKAGGFIDLSDEGCIYISAFCPVPSHVVVWTCYLLSVLSTLMFVQPRHHTPAVVLHPRNKTQS